VSSAESKRRDPDAIDHSWHPVRLLDDGRKLAAAACVVFLVSLFLPWYGKSFVPTGTTTFVKANISAFGAEKERENSCGRRRRSV